MRIEDIEFGVRYEYHNYGDEWIVIRFANNLAGHITYALRDELGSGSEVLSWWFDTPERAGTLKIRLAGVSKEPKQKYEDVVF